MTEKISVIIPVYNVENQLQTCLDSVLGQTYQNLEIILINYGSTDNSDAICRSYAARDSRILYFKKDNGGLSDARHIGIRQAKGTYVTYVDAEDWVEPTYLEELYKALQAHKADIAVAIIVSIRNRKIPFIVISRMKIITNGSIHPLRLLMDSLKKAITSILL